MNNKNKNLEYVDETIYIIQYPKGKLSVSFGILDSIYIDKNYNFNHKCSTESGSSGSPVLNINNKVIGIHKLGGIGHKLNQGTFLNASIKEFIQLNCHNKNGINYDDKENELLLKEFNKKYNLNITDIKSDKLYLNKKIGGNELLKNFSKIEFKELKELYLDHNNISDINALENANIEKLEILY